MKKITIVRKYSSALMILCLRPSGPEISESKQECITPENRQTYPQKHHHKDSNTPKPCPLCPINAMGSFKFTLL